MKQVSIEKADLASCVTQAQQGPVVITRRKRPIALIVAMDPEHLELGRNDKFWQLIVKRRKQKTISRAMLEQELNDGR